MATVFELDARLLKEDAVQDTEINKWTQLSDISNAARYFYGDAAQLGAAVKRIAHTIVTRYLNNPDVAAVPLHTKTKFCLILNNFALYKPVRSIIFGALEKLTNIFELSIKSEGTMPFDSELGRMSEHVLVLLMRCTNYSLKASAVHEFAEDNTQFAIQLLLAILLKEPPYEFELRCNCISGLWGFTQPQAFFEGGGNIQEHSCATFTEKVDFMLQLMLNLQATQVVSDILSEALTSSEALPPPLQRGIDEMMRTIMNIFKFCSKNATQWRQHVLLSTTFLDNTVTMYMQSLTSTLQKSLQKTPPSIPGNLLQSLNYAFKFGTFATYHLGEAAVEIRLFSTFFNDFFLFSIKPIVMDARLSGQFMALYINLLHFMSNVDVFCGDAAFPQRDLLPELSSEALKHTVESFLRREVASCGLPFTQAWYQQFHKVDTDCLIAMETVTYQAIEAIFTAIVKELQQSQLVTTPALPAQSNLLGEMPSLKPKQAQKISIGKAASPVKVQAYKFSSTAKANIHGVDPDLLCALSGNIMKTPVTSPYGHTFEKEVILNWLTQNGSVCPMTGKTLSPEQLCPNTAIASKIIQQLIIQGMASQPQNVEDDLYNF